MVKTRAIRIMIGKEAISSKALSTKRKKISQRKDNPSSDLPIVKVTFQSRDSDTPRPVKTQGGSSIPSKVKQKLVSIKTQLLHQKEGRL